MKNNRTINYTGVMYAPTTFKISFWKINLPWTFRLDTTMIFIFTYLVFNFLFKIPVEFSGKLFPKLDLAVSLGIPYLITMFLIGLPCDGKPIWLYVWDLTVYFILEKMPRKIYNHEQSIELLEEEVVFTSLEVLDEQRGATNEVNITAKNNSQKFIANK
ncbi:MULTISPECIES: TcpE family conjugal transfer membrane protein [unclassified Enterococcus]|uniref:TcpE family conjugal transfer membrane protein n=1 Tax=unclassified Enterococcus TaxID=2608891 RepID=UPI001905BD00|nr:MULTISPECIES: TcpE family conjugal transfer membrane protein [unclassified Enterococcus]MBK0036049.1 hypothetical protein [Enterococcus sp. S52]MBK0068707.1 hypothetical protein [Enterococcus sp. S53]MBK0139300.1 hypothetical protein [Enterococcus sp. S76]MBK0142935.1 hypothetical protein [Enterococcus sp. S77]